MRPWPTARTGSVFWAQTFRALLPPRKSRRTERAGTSGGWLIYPVMVGIGFYGGFIQAGVGFIIMAALRHLLAMDLITINMHKNWIILFYTVPILFIFGMTGNIDWMYALALAAGNGLGAWRSVKVSVRRGEKVVKIVLCIAILLMAVKFLVSF